jgi:hypothetical protein
VKEQRFVDIFQGAAYEEFRRQMNQSRLAVCANCDQYLKENQLVENRLASRPNTFYQLGTELAK